MADCCASLSNVGRHCGPNAAGIKPKIKIVCIEDVDLIPEAIEHVITAEIQLKATKSWKEWNISPIGGTVTGAAEGDVDGLTVNNTITCFIPAMAGEKSKTLDSANGGEFLVLYTDKNGKTWLFGEDENGAFLRVGYQTNDKNGYNITVEWPVGRLPYEYAPVAEGEEE